MENLNQEYNKLMEELLKPFPDGAIKQNKSGRPYIEVDTYIERLNEVAGHLWNWELTEGPTLYYEEEELLVRGILTIMGAKREGIGTAPLRRSEKGKVTNLKYGTRAASMDALRDACDLFGMGWKQLKQREASRKNKSEESSTRLSHATCTRCKTVLTVEEQKVLENHNVKLSFCNRCLPPHFLK
ncbi:hypothetical protein [Thalassobacillus sp. C254]|uniref:hypothetical protein n=1 Tax=Thalassobacillus sp. C254 TaxID=1225341 RepID=UPI0006CF2426|nr:hypothetical protein [Thalassobacillus sp. C254]